MHDRRCFVQFIHPGGEHWPDGDRLKRWNRGPHKRKFLKSPGRYLEAGELHECGIVFWGEWEPESRVVAEFGERLPRSPRLLYEPYYVTPSSDDWRQNTDPFVFGERFHYTGCLQHTSRGPTQLRYLTRGSLILFGSCLGKSDFVLDTVFVVSHCVDHNKRDYREQLDGLISETYRTVTIDPLYREGVRPGPSHRLYFGAAPECDVDGMFSFFPCEPFERRLRGFARPQIELPDFITPSLMQGKKIARDLSIGKLKELWDGVVRQVVRHGLSLGVHAELPPRQQR